MKLTIILAYLGAMSLSRIITMPLKTNNRRVPTGLWLGSLVEILVGTLIVTMGVVSPAPYSLLVVALASPLATVVGHYAKVIHLKVTVSQKSKQVLLSYAPADQSRRP